MVPLRQAVHHGGVDRSGVAVAREKLSSEKRRHKLAHTGEDRPVRVLIVAE